MHLEFTAEQESTLAEIAAHQGKPLEQILTESAALLLHEREHFLAAVDSGIEAANRGEFLEEEEMDARVEQMLKS